MIHLILTKKRHNTLSVWVKKEKEMKKIGLLILFCIMLPACQKLDGLLNPNNSVYVIPEADDSRMVVLNTNTHVYHDTKCKIAKSCSKNCIITTKSDAKYKGATPCQKCNGGNK